MSEKIRDFEVVSKYESEELVMPRRSTERSAGYDIYNQTGEDIVLQPGELSVAMTTKLKAYMQWDEVLFLLPRSGHGFKYSVRLANTVGVIDSDYYNNEGNEGEIFVKLHNQGEKPLIIPAGEAMVQGIFLNYLVTDTDELNKGGVRGGGIGSTTKTEPSTK